MEIDFSSALRVHVSALSNNFIKIFRISVLVEMTSFCQELLEYEIVAESRYINIDVCNHSTDLLVIDLYSLFDAPL